MGRLRVVLVALLVILGSSILTATPASASAPSVSYYVSLGDSLAQGVQPDPATGVNMVTDDGYPDQLFAKLKRSDPALQLIKLGCPGETTTTLINGGICPYQVSQLADARHFLQAHRGHIAYLTINVGSNDVLGCVDPATGIDPTCLAGAVRTVGVNLPVILGSLRSAVGRETVTAGMTYYDPILAAWVGGDTALARQSVVATDALNAVEAGAYRGLGFKVAPVAGAFQTDNFTIRAHSQLPVNVAKVCALTWMCTLGNIHPNKAGYALIARTFAETISCERRR